MNEGHLVCDSPEWRTAVREDIIPWAVGEVDLGDDVLEVGPGYGATTDVFAELLPRLTSVEIDPDLAARLQDRYRDTHVEVVLGDATNLPFPDERFTGAVCFSMLHHVPSPELQDRLFAEVARVLRSGWKYPTKVVEFGNASWEPISEARHHRRSRRPRRCARGRRG